MKHKLLFVGIIVLYLVTRIISMLHAGSFWFDEAFSVHFSSFPLSKMWTLLQFEHNPLIHFLSLHYWMQIFGSSEIAVRSLSLVAGFAALLLIYVLAKKLFNREAGLWAMLLMTLSTLQLYHQTEGRMYAMLSLFILAVIYCFWRWYKNQKSLKWLALFTVASILLVHTHITAWVLLIALAVFFFVEAMENKKSKVWSWLISNLIVLATFLIWFVPVAKNKFSAGHIFKGWFFSQTESGYWLEHLTNFFIAGETSMLIRSMTSLVVLSLLALGFVTIHKPDWWQKITSIFAPKTWPFRIEFNWTQKDRFLLILLIVPLAIGFGAQVTVGKYLMTSAIIVYLIAASSLAKLSKAAVKLLVAVALVLAVLPMHLNLLTTQRHQWNSAAATIKELSIEHPDAIILSHSFAWALPLNFYDYGTKDIVPFYPIDDDLSFDQRVVRYNWQGIVNNVNVEALAGILGDKSELILISSTPDEDERDPVKQWLWRNNWQLQDIHSFTGYGDPEIMVFIK